MRYLAVVLVCALGAAVAFGQSESKPRKQYIDKFRQLEEDLPTPNGYRTASGAPGREYWQQRADYVIDVELDDAKQRLIGSRDRSPTATSRPTRCRTSGSSSIRTSSPATPTPTCRTRRLRSTRCPTTRPRSCCPEVRRSTPPGRILFEALDRLVARERFDGGVKIAAVKDAKGAPLPYKVVKTMMRIDLPRAARAGQTVTFSVDWSYNINDAKLLGGRSGYEFFPKDGNYIYEIAQWFPRMAAYTDVHGLAAQAVPRRAASSRSSSATTTVRITAPDDHVVAATGVLQNPERGPQPQPSAHRLEQAKTAQEPVFVVTPEEARAAENDQADGQEDLGLQGRERARLRLRLSRKFIWDAQGHNVERQPRDGDVLLPEGGQSALGPVLDARHHAHAQRLFALHVHLSLSRGASRSTGPSAAWSIR